MFELEATTEIVRAGLAGIAVGWVTLTLALPIRRRFTRRRRPQEAWQRDRLSPALADVPIAAEDDRSESDLRQENIRLRIDAQEAVNRLQSAEARNQETMRRMADNQVLVQENEQAMGRVKNELEQMREFVTGQLSSTNNSPQSPLDNGTSHNHTGYNTDTVPDQQNAADASNTAVVQTNTATAALRSTREANRGATTAATVIDLTDSHAGLPGDGSPLWTALVSSNDAKFERQWSAIETSWEDAEGS